MKLLITFCLFLVTTYFTFAGEIISGKTYEITSCYLPQKSLSVKNSSLDKRAEVISWTQTFVNSQRWQISHATGNFHYLTNAYSEKALYYNNSRPKPGDKMVQEDNTGTSFFQWEFIPIENAAYPNAYYIRFSMQSSDRDLYLEPLDTHDGAAIQVELKRTGNDSIRQMWNIVETDYIPNKVTAELREAIMKGWKDYYYKKATVGYVIGSGGWWGDAEMIETVIDAFETTGDPVYKQMFTDLYANFTWRNRTDWSNNEYNDDIAWMVIAAARAYLIFDDGRYLNHAKNNFDKMYERALIPSGMLRWKQTPLNNQGTNSCINGPAQVAACYLAIATNDDSYYEKAKNLYALQRQYLFEPATGKVFDSGVWNNNVFSINNHWVSTYNQGTFLGAALMLYNRYGDEFYKNDAHKIVEWTRKDLCNSHGVIRVCGSGNDLQGFKGILMRYLRRYIVDLAVPESVEWLQRNVLHGFNNRNSKGIIWTAWWEKSTENFVFSDGYNYINQPFGSSTAVSAAFNAPLDKNLIIKDAFSIIEAEHFDYLKGVLVEKNVVSAGAVIGNIQNNYHTAYNNVVFGNEVQVNNASFRVLSGNTAGTIEIRTGSASGQLIGTVNIPADDTGTWTNITCPIETVISGRHNIYLVFKGSSFRIDSFLFNSDETSVKNTTFTSHITLYPNPTANTLHVKHPESGYLRVYDTTGKKVYSSTIYSGVTRVIDVAEFTPGIYFVETISANGKNNARFLKK